MSFGDGITAPDTVAQAEWIERTCRRSTWGTVGALVPDRYRMVLRVQAPDPTLEDWWAAYMALFEIIASVGKRHTSTPDHAWFAVWEGHGFDLASTRVAWLDPPGDDLTRRARDEYRVQLRDEDERRRASIGTALGDVPRVDLPNRAYYLLEGSVLAVTRLRYPDSMDDWRNPDLYWPDDRQWFVGTDVDFWSLYIGGDGDFIEELASSVPTSAEIVTPDLQLESED